MRLAWLGVAFLAFLGAFVAWSFTAEASSVCGHGTGATGNWCQGDAYVSLAGATSSRYFHLTTASASPGASPVNQATWELNPGASITLYYHPGVAVTGGIPDPTAVHLRVYYETGTGTLVRTLSTGTPPAAGTSYTFFATDTGLVGGSPRAGTLRLQLNVILTGTAGGLFNYDANSDGTCTSGASVTCGPRDAGAVRVATFVSSITRSAYPSGSTYAYGTSGDESVTITATFTQPFGDTNLETMQEFLVDKATLATYGAVGATADADGTTQAASFVIDSTFPTAGAPYVRGMNTLGNSPFTGLKGTKIAATGHGANIVALSDVSAYDSTDIAIDPGINFDADGSGTADDLWPVKLGTCSGALVSVVNKGETACAAGYLLNARNQQLTRAMTIAREDATPTTCATAGSVSPTAGLYTWTFTTSTGATCASTATTTGAPRYFRATNTDQSDRSLQTFAVSTLLFVDSHLQSSSTLATDNYPTEDATEVLGYYVRSDGLGGDASDTVRQWCHVVGVRKDVNIDTSGSAVSRSLVDPTAATRASGTTDTDSTGWTTTSLNLLAGTPLGSWTAPCTATFNGNTGTDSEPFTVSLEAVAGENFMGDPLKIFGGDEAFTGEVVRLAISESFLDGTARTGNAAGTFIRILNPSNVLEVTDATPTEVSHGVYRYDWTPATTGPYVVLARTTDPDSGDPVGTSNIVYVRDPAMAAGNYSGNLSTILALLQTHDDLLEEKLGPPGEPVQLESYPAIILLWAVALVIFLRLAKLAAAAASTLGLGVTLAFYTAFPGDFFWGWQILAAAVLGISLWLEALIPERIYARFFTGTKGATE